MGLLARSLELGGTEIQLVRLATELHRRGIACYVLVLYSIGPLKEDLDRAGIPIIDLEKRGRWDATPFLKVASFARRNRLSILQSYLDAPNIISAVAAPFISPTKVVWGFRSSYMDLDSYDYSWRLAHLAQVVLSRLPSLTIANSQAGARQLSETGFPTSRVQVVPNGIDTEYFARTPEIVASASRLRAEWDVPPNHQIIGLVGRLDPMKDHETFVRAAAISCLHRDDITFVCIGPDGQSKRSALEELTRSLGIEDRFIWTGPLTNMPPIYATLNILSTSSKVEGFPNVVAEAMAMEVPTVVTDVGDSAIIVNARNRVVPPRSPDGLASAWLDVLSMDESARRDLGSASRVRIIENYSVKTMVDSTLSLYRGLLTGSRNLAAPDNVLR